MQQQALILLQHRERHRRPPRRLLGAGLAAAEKSGLVGKRLGHQHQRAANQNGLYKKPSNLNANTLLTRDNAAQMIHNAWTPDNIEPERRTGNHTTSQYSHIGI
ncbi:MAG: hypothetical protein ACLRWQ_20875 [Flavonifractor plautii]